MNAWIYECLRTFENASVFDNSFSSDNMDESDFSHSSGRLVTLFVLNKVNH